MIITRFINNEPVDFELTDDEIYQAYRIQEHKFQISDMAYRLEGFEDDEELGDVVKEILEDKSALEYVAGRYEYYADDREDGDFEYETTREAIQRYIYKKNHKEDKVR